jgi:hypothetical protein
VAGTEVGVVVGAGRIASGQGIAWETDTLVVRVPGASVVLRHPITA